MFCTECGAHIPNGSTFCTECGTKLASADTPPADTPEQDGFDPAGENSSAASAYTAPTATPESNADATAVIPEPTFTPRASQAETDDPAGFSAADETTAMPAVSTTPDAAAPDEAAPDTEEDAPKKNPKKAIIIGVVVGAVVLAGAGTGGALYYKHMLDEQAAEQAAAEQAAYDEAHQTYPAPVEINAEGLDTSTGTKIPLHVTGTDFEGNEVDTVFYTDNKSTDVSLMQGTYEFSVSASPIAADGTMYDAAATENPTLGGSMHEDGYFETQNFITLNPLDPAGVTDEQIDQAREAALDSGMDESRVDELVSAAEKCREEAQADTSNATHIVTDSYSFDIPAYWDGRVTAFVEGDDVEIRSNAYPDRTLVRISVESGDVQGGDIATGMVGAAYDLGGGRHVVVRKVNHPYLAASAYHNGSATSKSDENFYTQAEADELTDLLTGGAYTYSQALDDFESNGPAITYVNTYLDSTINSSIRAR